MDTSPAARAARRRGRGPVDAAADHPVPAARARGRGPQAARSANDAVWWVVLYQGALDYTRSIGGADQDADAATRLVESYPAVRRP